MHKITVDFKDMNEVEQTEDFYFNLNEEELIEMEVEVDGGLAGHWQRIIDSKDNRTIYAEFKKILFLSYGQKSADAKRFIKNEKTREYLQSHVAFPKLLVNMITDEGAASAFVRELIPDLNDLEMVKAAEKQNRKQPQDRLRQRERPPRGTRIVEDVDLPVGEEETDANIFFDKDLFDYTAQEMAGWDEERMHAWKFRVANTKI